MVAPATIRIAIAASAKAAGLPGSVMATGAVDLCLAVASLAAAVSAATLSRKSSFIQRWTRVG